MDEYPHAYDAATVCAGLSVFVQKHGPAETSSATCDRCIGVRSLYVSPAKLANLASATAFAGNAISLALDGYSLNGRIDNGGGCRPTDKRGDQVEPIQKNAHLRRHGDLDCVYIFTQRS